MFKNLKTTDEIEITISTEAVLLVNKILSASYRIWYKRSKICFTDVFEEFKDMHVSHKQGFHCDWCDLMLEGLKNW